MMAKTESKLDFTKTWNMKVVTKEIDVTFNEMPTGILDSLVGKCIISFFTYRTIIPSLETEPNSSVHSSLYFKTSDGFIYKMISEEYTEDHYFDIKKTSIEVVEQIEVGFMEFRLPDVFFINKIYIFSLQQQLMAEKWHIESIRV